MHIKALKKILQNLEERENQVRSCRSSKRLLGGFVLVEPFVCKYISQNILQRTTLAKWGLSTPNEYTVSCIKLGLIRCLQSQQLYQTMHQSACRVNCIFLRKIKIMGNLKLICSQCICKGLVYLDTIGLSSQCE